jgi:hypothetical protein
MHPRASPLLKSTVAGRLQVARTPGAGVAGKRSQDGESADSIERAEGRMPVANVRRWGCG